MASKKRKLKEIGEGSARGGGGSPPEKKKKSRKKKKRSRLFDPETREGRQMQTMLEAALESVVPPIVEKVVTRVLTGFVSRAPSTFVDENSPPRYKLTFTNGLATKIFTRKPICDRNGDPLKICMTATHQEGADPQLLSAKIRLVVLEGDFNSHNQECWTRDEFSNSIVRPRDRVAALLTGDPDLNLTNGEASLCGFTILDNSKFTRSGKFRLGVMVTDNIGERVQEGITEPFIVKDRRGEGSEKHDIPLLNDDVWRLHKISKNGTSHVALKGSGIFLVKDFLRLYYKDEQALRKILIRAKESVWTTIVGHAKKCCPGTELYSYIIKGKSATLFFNSVCQIVGVTFGDTYTSFDDLEKSKKDKVVKWSKIAYKNMAYDQHDYEMDNGEPRPINQEFQGLTIEEHECNDSMQGHRSEGNGDYGPPDDEQVTSGSHSKQHDSEGLESVEITQNEQEQQQQHLEGVEQEHETAPRLEQPCVDEQQQDREEQEQEAAAQQEQQQQEEEVLLLEQQEQEVAQVQEQEQQHLDKLVAEAAWLQAENVRAASRAADMDARCSRVEQENVELRARAAELGQRLRSVNEVLHVVEEFCGVATGNQEAGQLAANDPWQLLCLAATVPIGSTGTANNAVRAPAPAPPPPMEAVGRG